MRLSKQDYNELIRKHPNLAPKIPADCASHQRLSDTKLQESKDDMREALNNAPKVQGENGCHNPRYKVTVTFLMSDNRRRDLDGMLATILDAICTAGRLLAGDTSHNGRRKKSP